MVRGWVASVVQCVFFVGLVRQRAHGRTREKAEGHTAAFCTGRNGGGFAAPVCLGAGWSLRVAVCPSAGAGDDLRRGDVQEPSARGEPGHARPHVCRGE